MKYAVIDIGSNSVRLVIYKVENQKIKTMLSEKNTAGLNNDIEDKKLTKKGMKKLIRILNDFNEIILNFPDIKIYAFATAALRKAKNQAEILDQVKAATNIDIDIISGEKEANLGYKGLVSGFALERGINIDIGGASTELLFYENQEIKAAHSLNHGSLSLFSQYVAAIVPTKKEMKAIEATFQKALDALPKSPTSYPEITGIGGSIRAIRALASEYFPNYKEEDPLSLQALEELKKKLTKNDPTTVKKLLKAKASRVHTVGPALGILTTIMKQFSAEKIHIADSGIREGYLNWKLEENRAK